MIDYVTTVEVTPVVWSERTKNEDIIRAVFNKAFAMVKALHPNAETHMRSSDEFRAFSVVVEQPDVPTYGFEFTLESEKKAQLRFTGMARIASVKCTPSRT